MGLSRIKRILQIKKGVIHRGQRPYLTIASIQSIFKLLKEKMSSMFSAHEK